jgi:(p)ppGpp synthase/HD superfamily hydrolase
VSINQKIDKTLVDKAIAHAVEAHCGQYRKGSNIPYIAHPIEVMKKISSWGVKDPEILAAAVLHDVVEDCGYRHSYIEQEFSKRVADIVMECSRPDGHESKRQKLDFLNTFKDKSPESVIIKLADRLCNCSDYERERSRGNIYHLAYGLQAYTLWHRYMNDIDSINAFSQTSGRFLLLSEVTKFASELYKAFKIDVFEDGQMSKVEEKVL